MHFRKPTYLKRFSDILIVFNGNLDLNVLIKYVFTFKYYSQQQET